MHITEALSTHYVPGILLVMGDKIEYCMFPAFNFMF